MDATPAKVGVLFLSSAEWPGADTFIHALLMRGLDRSRFEVHLACSAGTPDARTPAIVAALVRRASRRLRIGIVETP